MTSSDGPNGGGAVSSTADGGDFDWNNQSNVLTDDTSTTDSTVLDVGDTTYLLKIQSFGFLAPSNFADLGPAVEAKVRRKGDEVADLKIQLLDASGNLTGDNKAAGGNWPVSAATATYGSDSDNWSLSLSESLVESSGFGIGISAQEGATAPGITPPEIEYVTLTIYWTEPTSVIAEWKLPAAQLAEIELDAELPVAWSGIINTITLIAALPTDWVAEISSHDVGLPAAWMASLAHDSDLPANWTAQPTVDYAMSSSWRQTAAADSLLPAAWELSTFAAHDFDLPADWLSGIAHDTPLPASWLASTRIEHDTPLPASWTANPGHDVNMPAEWSHAPQFTADLAASWRGKLTAHDVQLPAAWHARLAAIWDAELPAEILHNPGFRVALTAAWHSRLQAVRVLSLPASWAATLASHDVAFDTEQLATLSSRDAELAASWVAEITAPTFDIPSAWPAGLAHPVDVAASWLGQPQTDFPISASWNSATRHDANLASSWRSTPESRDFESPVSWQGVLLARVVDLVVEKLGTVQATTGLPVEWTGTVPTGTPSGIWEVDRRSKVWDASPRPKVWATSGRRKIWEFENRNNL